MEPPLLPTTFSVPAPRRTLVARPRLLQRLRLGADAKVTLIAAPAGFGKTTLLAAWLSEPDDDRCAAWVSLDAVGDDPASFWAAVVAALERAVPGIGSSASELLASGTAPVELVMTALLNELAQTPRGVWLVLDDYHLSDSPAVGQGMAFLVEHLPPHVHVVISTRADPDLALARWRVRGELIEIRSAELRFTADETTAYLALATGEELRPADVAVLAERTEGWIAALQLAALSLRGRDDVSGFIARFAGDHRYIVDYLLEEVLSRQPDVIREFLLDTAILARLTGSLCDAVTGGDGGNTMLAGLERANLFTVALDDHREWYRYHHLFADVLRARLLSEQPDRVPLLHGRASRWYEGRGLRDEAIRHALASQDLERAVRLIELAVPSIRRHRQEATMYGWLTALPDDAVRRSPVLSVFYGSMLMAAGDLGAVEARIDDAEAALAAPDGEGAPSADTEEIRTLPSTIAIYRASIAQARGDVAGTAAHARRALDLAGPDDHLARGGAAGFLGFAAWADGDVSRALETFGQAVSSLHAAGNLVDELSSTVVLSDLWLAAGRPMTARRLSVRALRRAEAGGAPLTRAAAALHVGLSEIDLEAGDLESAERHLEAAAAAGARTSTAEGGFRWFVAMGRVAQVRGDTAKAVEFLDQAEQRYRPGFFPDVRPIAAVRARVWLAAGRLPEAAEWARDRGVSVDDEASYLREFEHLTLVRLLLAQHRQHGDIIALTRAVGLLERLRSAAEAAGRDGSLLEIRMLQSLAHDAQGHRAEAVASLNDAGQRPAAALETAGHGTRAPVTPLSDPLSGRELEVLGLLDSELTGPEIARQLFVSHNTLRSHTKHIFTKLDVTNRRAAVRRARELGVL